MTYKKLHLYSVILNPFQVLMAQNYIFMQCVPQNVIIFKGIDLLNYAEKNVELQTKFIIIVLTHCGF